VCRQHDRALKRKVVASRPKAAPPEQEPATTKVCCGACGRPLAEASSLPIEQREPCPHCRSLKRTANQQSHEGVSFHDSLRTQSRRPSKGGWLVDTQAGDDYTMLLVGWGSLERTKDREKDQYREFIKLHDGTSIESVARLSDHHD